MTALPNPERPGQVRIGATWLLLAQGIFLITSYALHVILGRRLGPVEYGLFGIVLYTSNMVRTFVASGLPMAVGRYVSAERQQAESVYRAGFRLQALMGLGISLPLFLFADPLAGILGDPALAPLFRIVSPIVIFYGLFFLVIQYWNGLQKYRIQSLLMSIYYSLRLVLVVAPAVLGWHVAGAVGGLMFTSVVTGILAMAVRRPQGENDPFPQSRLIAFATPLVLASVVQALLIDLDIMFVKRLVPATAASGWYTSAKALAQIILFAFMALSNALYPAVSNAWAAGDTARLRRYVEQSNRWLLLTVIPLAVITGWQAEGLLNLVYGDRYLEAAPALRWLMVSFGLLSAFIIHKTIITGCGFPRLAGILTVMLLPLYVVLQLVFIPRWGLAGAAAATAVSFGVGVLGSFAVVWTKVRAGLNWCSTARLLGAGAGLALAEYLVSLLSLPFLPRLILPAMVYLALVLILGELQRAGLRDLGERYSCQGDTE